MSLKHYRQFRFREKIVYPSYTGMSFARDAAEDIFLCACVIVKKAWRVGHKIMVEFCTVGECMRSFSFFAKRILQKNCVNDSLLYMYPIIPIYNDCSGQL